MIEILVCVRRGRVIKKCIMFLKESKFYLHKYVLRQVVA